MNPDLLPDNFDFQNITPLWSVHSDRKSIERTFIFKDFEQAFEFMTLVAQYAQELDHHPDWSNAWNKVRVSLTTHSAGTLTTLDIQLAKAMDAFASQVNPI